MTSEELVLQIQKGIDAKQNMTMLYQQNIGLIRKQAGKRRRFCEFDDLMQIGGMALMRAVKTFEPEKGLFSTYCTNWIISYMQRYIDDTRGCVHVPVEIQRRNVKLRRFRQEFENKYNRLPTDAEIMKEFEISLPELYVLNTGESYKHIDSLDRTLQTESETITLSDSLQSSDDVEEEALRTATKDELWSAAKELLTDRQYEVLTMRFRDNMSLQGTGNVLNLTRERIRQIEAKSLRILMSDNQFRQIASMYS